MVTSIARSIGTFCAPYTVVNVTLVKDEIPQPSYTACLGKVYLVWIKSKCKPKERVHCLPRIQHFLDPSTSLNVLTESILDGNAGIKI